jgi:hypothetical protein
MLTRIARYRGSTTADLRDLNPLRLPAAKLAHCRNSPCRGIIKRSRIAVMIWRRQLLLSLTQPVYCHRVAGHRVASHFFTKPGLIYVWN